MTTARPALLLAALAVTGHLWMLHGPGDHARSVAAVGAEVRVAAAPDGDGHLVGLGCLAALSLCAGLMAVRRQRLDGAAVRLRVAAEPAPVLLRREIWPPPSPGDRRVRSGTVLLV